MAESEIEVSLQKLSSPPKTDLTVTRVQFTRPDALPVDGTHRSGAFVSIEGRREVPDPYGGMQTAYHGFVSDEEGVVGEFEIRTGSGLLAVWSDEHYGRTRNELAVQQALSCLEHCGHGASRQELWGIAAPRAQVAVGRTFDDGPTRLDVDARSMEELTDYLFDYAKLEVDGVPGTVEFYSPSYFEFEHDGLDFRDAYPVVEMVEATMTESRRPGV